MFFYEIWVLSFPEPSRNGLFLGLPSLRCKNWAQKGDTTSENNGWNPGLFCRGEVSHVGFRGCEMDVFRMCGVLIDFVPSFSEKCD